MVVLVAEARRYYCSDAVTHEAQCEQSKNTCNYQCHGDLQAEQQFRGQVLVKADHYCRNEEEYQDDQVQQALCKHGAKAATGRKPCFLAQEIGAADLAKARRNSNSGDEGSINDLDQLP